jgi:hypothetical protein
MALGDIDEHRIVELEGAGLVVDDVAPASLPTAAAMTRGTMSRETEVEGWRTGDAFEIPPPEPGALTQWLVSLSSPSTGQMRVARKPDGVTHGGASEYDSAN